MATKLVTIIFVNGPPRSGKDAFGRSLAKKYQRVDTFKFASPLRAATEAALEAVGVPVGDYEQTKDTPFDAGTGGTLRQAMIAMSEQLIKPLLGQGYLGRCAAESVLDFLRRGEHSDLYEGAPGTRTIVFTDSGFAAEADELLGALRCARPDTEFRPYVVELHCEGGTFEGDSRSAWGATRTDIPLFVFWVPEPKNEEAVSHPVKWVAEYLKLTETP